MRRRTRLVLTSAVALVLVAGAAVAVALSTKASPTARPTGLGLPRAGEGSGLTRLIPGGGESSARFDQEAAARAYPAREIPADRRQRVARVR